MRKTLSLFTLFLTAATFSNAQSQGGGTYDLPNNAQQPCISKAQYDLIDKRCDQNASLLGIQPKSERETQSVLYQWPLKQANGLNDCGYYFISAYVDHNNASGAFKDYDCGSTSYDGHAGTDFVPWPYPMNKMDRQETDVIAGEAGTILDKQDGQDDRNCGPGNDNANYIVLYHADGNRTLYFHMKKHSLTSKTVGDTISAGEFLGKVGSSGFSSGPHLHFEVRSGINQNTSIDPYLGTCNTISSSLWADQKPYSEPSIVKTTVNFAPPETPGCPSPETENEASCFDPGALGYFVLFMRDQTVGMTINMKILGNSGVVSTWNFVTTTTQPGTWIWFSRNLPTAEGSYTFAATYNGMTCTRDFQIGSCTMGVNEATGNSFNVYPNPSNGQFRIESSNLRANRANTAIEVYNIMGSPVYKAPVVSASSGFSLDVPAGCYFYQIRQENSFLQSGKLIIE